MTKKQVKIYLDEDVLTELKKKQSNISGFFNETAKNYLQTVNNTTVDIELEIKTVKENIIENQFKLSNLYNALSNEYNMAEIETRKINTAWHKLLMILNSVTEIVSVYDNKYSHNHDELVGLMKLLKLPIEIIIPLKNIFAFYIDNEKASVKDNIKTNYIYFLEYMCNNDKARIDYYNNTDVFSKLYNEFKEVV